MDFFRAEQAQRGPLAAVGVGCFGPVDLRETSATWGFITTTPKAGWANVDVAGRLTRDLGVPVAFDTDVNAAAFGEARWGAAQGLDTFVYLTVGTGIGGGGLQRGQPMHGLVHPEMGHMLLPRDPSADPFPGVCPFHGGCLEGLASGPAMLARWGQPAESLPADHPAWALEARYLALAAVNLVCTLSPQRIVLGGGVMEQAQLFPPRQSGSREAAQRLHSGRRDPGCDRHVHRAARPREPLRPPWRDCDGRAPCGTARGGRAAAQRYLMTTSVRSSVCGAAAWRSPTIASHIDWALPSFTRDTACAS